MLIYQIVSLKVDNTPSLDIILARSNSHSPEALWMMAADVTWSYSDVNVYAKPEDGCKISELCLFYHM